MESPAFLMLSDVPSRALSASSLTPSSTTPSFGEMLHGYNNRTQHVNQGQVFQMTLGMGADTCTSLVKSLTQNLGRGRKPWAPWDRGLVYWSARLDSQVPMHKVLEVSKTYSLESFPLTKAFVYPILPFSNFHIF